MVGHAIEIATRVAKKTIARAARCVCSSRDVEALVGCTQRDESDVIHADDAAISRRFIALRTMRSFSSGDSMPCLRAAIPTSER
jgi:hypothetical protein